MRKTDPKSGIIRQTKDSAKNDSPRKCGLERIFDGSKISDSQSVDLESPPFKISLLVKKGHEECGDSAFVYSDGSKIMIGVFDGVSGEPGASRASGDAARSVLGSLRGKKRASEEDLLEAFKKADIDIRIGFTTALVLFLECGSGKFAIASIGDSVSYSRDSKGEVSLELPISRVVREKDSIMRFFTYRNIVSSIIGQGRNQDSSAHPAGDVAVRSGRLMKGETIILASDALSDNLFVKVKDGFVADPSGIGDLRDIIGKKSEPKWIVAKLLGEVGRRIKAGRVEKEGAILVPKQDDLSIAVVSRSE